MGNFFLLFFFPEVQHGDRLQQGVQRVTVSASPTTGERKGRVRTQKQGETTLRAEAAGAAWRGELPQVR